MHDLYQMLGIERGADQAAIKQAYRKLAQQNHPDKGGDKEAFQAIQQAYDVLSDSEKREHYDATGTVPGKGKTVRDEAMAIIVKAVGQALEAQDPDFDNILKTSERMIGAALEELCAKRAELQRGLDKVRKAMKRARAADGKIDTISPVLLHLEAKLAGPIAHMDLGHSAMELAVEILKDHLYSVDVRPPYAGQDDLRGAWARQVFGNFGI
jgi:curved DNA-binding protein CbpA